MRHRAKWPGTRVQSSAGHPPGAPTTQPPLDHSLLNTCLSAALHAQLPPRQVPQQGGTRSDPARARPPGNGQRPRGALVREEDGERREEGGEHGRGLERGGGAALGGPGVVHGVVDGAGALGGEVRLGGDAPDGRGLVGALDLVADPLADHLAQVDVLVVRLAARRRLDHVLEEHLGHDRRLKVARATVGGGLAPNVEDLVVGVGRGARELGHDLPPVGVARLDGAGAREGSAVVVGNDDDVSVLRVLREVGIRDTEELPVALVVEIGGGGGGEFGAGDAAGGLDELAVAVRGVALLALVDDPASGGGGAIARLVVVGPDDLGGDRDVGIGGGADPPVARAGREEADLLLLVEEGGDVVDPLGGGLVGGLVRGADVDAVLARGPGVDKVSVDRGGEGGGVGGALVEARGGVVRVEAHVGDLAVGEELVHAGGRRVVAVDALDGVALTHGLKELEPGGRGDGDALEGNLEGGIGGHAGGGGAAPLDEEVGLGGGAGGLDDLVVLVVGDVVQGGGLGGARGDLPGEVVLGGVAGGDGAGRDITGVRVGVLDVNLLRRRHGDYGERRENEPHFSWSSRGSSSCRLLWLPAAS
mmetsp:Transcript_50782/g.126419  ORF Transcript_50782/g.126419 Transcript_50782/m.126419 type:complete len:589 (-) Transcript_50782:16-1782(-)